MAAIAIGLAVDVEVAGLVAGYGVATAAYTLILKRLVIVDVMTIAGLFILRVVAGAVAVGVQASEWLLVCTAMLALFLGFTKRRQEAMLEEQLPAASSISLTDAASSLRSGRRRVRGRRVFRQPALSSSTTHSPSSTR